MRHKRWWIKAFCVFFPAFGGHMHPSASRELVLLSGVMQAIMLPMLAAATLTSAIGRCDRRIASAGFGTDVVALRGRQLIAGAWAGANGSSTWSADWGYDRNRTPVLEEAGSSRNAVNRAFKVQYPRLHGQVRQTLNLQPCTQSCP